MRGWRCRSRAIARVLPPACCCQLACSSELTSKRSKPKISSKPMVEGEAEDEAEDGVVAENEEGARAVLTRSTTYAKRLE